MTAGNVRASKKLSEHSIMVWKVWYIYYLLSVKVLSVINYLLSTRLHAPSYSQHPLYKCRFSWWHYVKKNLLKQLLNWVELVTWHVRKRSASNTWGSEDDVIKPPPPTNPRRCYLLWSGGVPWSRMLGSWSSKMTAAPTAISTCGEQQQSAWQLSPDRWDDGFPGPGPAHTA